MTVSATIVSELAFLQKQCVAAAPLANAPHSTVVALQLNAGKLVSDVQAALAATSVLDNYQSSADPGVIVTQVATIFQNGVDQSNLALTRGLVGRVALNLDQL